MFSKIKKLNKIELLATAILLVISVLFLVQNVRTQRQEARNEERVADLSQQDFLLKKFFEEEGYYPSEEDYADQDWREDNLDKPNSVLFVPPSGVVSGTAEYLYQPKADEEECVKAGKKCNNFTLTTSMEAGEPDFVRKSL